MSISDRQQEKQERCKHELLPRDCDFCRPVREEIARRVARAPRTLGGLLDRIQAERGAAWLDTGNAARFECDAGEVGDVEDGVA